MKVIETSQLIIWYIGLGFKTIFDIMFFPLTVIINKLAQVLISFTGAGCIDTSSQDVGVSFLRLFLMVLLLFFSLKSLVKGIDFFGEYRA